MNLFLSYAREDKEHMEGLEKTFSKSVRDKKFSLWIDKNKIISGSFLDHRVKEAIEKANIVLLLLGSDFWSSDYIQDTELPFILKENQERGLLIYPIILRDLKDFFRYKDIFPNEITASPFDEDGNLTPIEDFISINNRYAPFKAYNKIAEDIEKISETLFYNPYKHLFYFETEDSDNFYGREKISHELAINILNVKIALLSGESGVGKTSLILAGVFPILNRNQNFKSIYIYCRGNLLSFFKETIIKELNANQELEIKDMIINFLKFKQKKLLFVFDQFEQIFLSVSKEDRESFFDIIYQIKEEITDVHIVFSLREDYFTKLDIYRDRFQELWNNSTFLYRMEKEEVLNAIIKPLRKDSISLELANKIYEDLLTIDNDSREKIFTPLLQLALFELYKKALTQNSTKITDKLYTESGGVYKVLENYFDNVFKQFNKEESKILIKFFSLLTASITTKNSISKDKLDNYFLGEEQKEVYRIIDILIKNRVIRYTTIYFSTGIEEYYEFTHDILVGLIRNKFITVNIEKEPIVKDVNNAFITPQKRFTFSKKKYKAFISYSRIDKKDEEVASRLYKELESYKIPKRLYDTCPNLPKTLYPIFKDTEQLSATPDLTESIREALIDSEYLIVICSPRTKESKWVKKEIDTFIELGRSNKILTLIIEGSIEETIPYELMDVTKIPLASDVRDENEQLSIKKLKDAKLKLIAPIIGCDFDDLLNSVQRETGKRRRVITISLILFTIIIVIMTIFIQDKRLSDCLKREKLFLSSDKNNN